VYGTTHFWRLNKCPRSGIFNKNRIKAKLRYKCAIKEAVIAADEDFNEDLVKHLCIKNFNGFWKAWRKRFCSKDLKPTSRLNNSVGDVNILAEFSNHFSYLASMISIEILFLNICFLTLLLDRLDSLYRYL